MNITYNILIFFYLRQKPCSGLTSAKWKLTVIKSGINMLFISCYWNSISTFKDFQIQQLKKSKPDLTLLDDRGKTVSGKKVGFFKFVTQAVDQKAFNYYFFPLVERKIMLFTFKLYRKITKELGGNGRQNGSISTRQFPLTFFHFEKSLRNRIVAHIFATD